MSNLAFAPFLSLLLSVATMGGAARKDPGEYWVAVMEEEPMPEAISGLVSVLDSRPNEEDLPHGRSHSRRRHWMTKDCKTEKSSDQKKSYTEDFDPRPNISAYSDEGVKVDDREKKFSDELDPRPNISAYGDDGVKVDDKEKKFANEFDPRPNISAYGDDSVKLTREVKKKLTDDFEPMPNTLA